MEMEIIMLNETCQTQKGKCGVCSHMRNLDFTRDKQQIKKGKGPAETSRDGGRHIGGNDG